MLVKRPRTWEDAVRERGAAVRRDHADRDAAVAHPHALQRRGDDTGTPRGSRGGREGGPRGAARAPADRGTGEAGRRGHDRVRRRDRRVLRPDPVPRDRGGPRGAPTAGRAAPARGPDLREPPPPEASPRGARADPPPGPRSRVPAPPPVPRRP